MRLAVALAFAGIVSIAIAQNSTVASSDTYTINPDSVSSSLRDAWCNSQISNCPLICLQTIGNSLEPASNTCDSDSLTYSCICSNGISPNASESSQTLPYFICSEWGNQCVANCGSNSQCSADCRDNHPCGAQNPIRVNTSTITTSTMPKTTAAVGGDATNTADAASTANFSTGNSGALPALELGQAYGLMVVIAGVFGGFALLA